MAQSHGLCGGRQVALYLLKTAARSRYAEGTSGVTETEGLSMLVALMGLARHWETHLLPQRSSSLVDQEICGS